jgi:hypothetical protein
VPGRRRRLTFKYRTSDTPMSSQDWEAAEELLAKLIARAYALDHPELFGDLGFMRQVPNPDDLRTEE